MSERGEVFDRLVAWIDEEHARGTSMVTIAVMLTKCAAGLASSCQSERAKFLTLAAEEFDKAERT